MAVFNKLSLLSGGSGVPEEIIADFASAVKLGPYRVGERAFFFREGLRSTALPYGEFAQVYKRSQLCAARHCGGVDHFDTFWLVFCRADAELCAAKTIDEKYADAAMEALRAKLPDVRFGV